MMVFDFTIRYAVIPANEIYNECGPNPDRLGSQEQVEKMIQSRNNRDRFYEKLEESIMREGLRNPILICAGWCPEKKMQRLPKEMQSDPSKILVCDRHGGSRLYIAQKYNMKIPCIVSDFCGMFPKCKVLNNINEIEKHFQDKPDRITINTHGVHVRKLPQVHL